MDPSYIGDGRKKGYIFSLSLPIYEPTLHLSAFVKNSPNNQVVIDVNKQLYYVMTPSPLLMGG